MTVATWACCTSSIGPECGHRLGGAEVTRRREELERIAREFPMRDRRGNVTGFYVYARRVDSQRVAGPFATQEEAEAARKGLVTAEGLDIICGHVFTDWGTIVREWAAA